MNTSSLSKGRRDDFYLHDIYIVWELPKMKNGSPLLPKDCPSFRVCRQPLWSISVEVRRRTTQRIAMKLQPSLSTTLTASTLASILASYSCTTSPVFSHHLILSQSIPVGTPQIPTNDFGSSEGFPIAANSSNIKKKSFFNFRFMESFFRNILTIFVTDPDTLRIVAKACSWITWTFIILSAFGTFGFDTKPLLSLLSVSGLTIGFAAKDILTNLFKGFFILLTKPFKRGWIISVNGFRGKVLSIDSRFVRLQSFIDKNEILVPLSMIYDTAIVIEKKGDTWNQYILIMRILPLSCQSCTIRDGLTTIRRYR